MTEQELADLIEAVVSGDEQRRPAELTLLVHVRASIEQSAHRFDVAVARGEDQSGACGDAACHHANQTKVHPIGCDQQMWR